MKCRARIIVSLILALICLTLVCGSFVGCQEEEDSNDDYDYSYSASITQSQAISTAKSSSKVQDAIADRYDMKFYYTPDWGTCTAKEDYHGGWEVVLKGTISGYTDDYKKDFVYDKTFKATVTVSETGYVKNVRVSDY